MIARGHVEFISARLAHRRSISSMCRYYARARDMCTSVGAFHRVSSRVALALGAGSPARHNRFSMVSDERKQQLRKDRERTRAISAYLSDVRTEILSTLNKTFLRDPTTKRREMERKARLRFKLEPEEVQARYFSNVSAEEGLESGGRSGVKRVDVLASSAPPASGRSGVKRACVRAPSTPRARPMASPCPPAKRREGSNKDATQALPTSGVSLKVESSWCSGSSGSRLHDLVCALKPLKILFGDAGALETLAAGLRILDAVDMRAWADRDQVKIAIVTGLAAKYTQTCAEKQVLKLWTSLGGKFATKKRMCELERQVFSAWATSGLVPHEYLQRKPK